MSLRPGWCPAAYTQPEPQSRASLADRGCLPRKHPTPSVLCPDSESSHLLVCWGGLLPWVSAKTQEQHHPLGDVFGLSVNFVLSKSNSWNVSVCKLHPPQDGVFSGIKEAFGKRAQKPSGLGGGAGVTETSSVSEQGPVPYGF